MRGLPKFLVVLLFTLSLTACYRPDIQQGNDYPLSNVQKLKIGMDKKATLELMGQPLLSNIFTKDYLTYVYYHYPTRGKITRRHITLYFKDNKLMNIQRADSSVF